MLNIFLHLFVNVEVCNIKIWHLKLVMKFFQENKNLLTICWNSPNPLNTSKSTSRYAYARIWSLSHCKCILSDARFSHTIYRSSFQVAANSNPIKFHFTFSLGSCAKNEIYSPKPTVYFTSTDLKTITLWARKYIVNNSLAKSWVPYSCE